MAEQFGTLAEIGVEKMAARDPAARADVHKDQQVYQKSGKALK